MNTEGKIFFTMCLRKLQKIMCDVKSARCVQLIFNAQAVTFVKNIGHKNDINGKANRRQHRFYILCCFSWKRNSILSSKERESHFSNWPRYYAKLFVAIKFLWNIFFCIHTYLENITIEMCVLCCDIIKFVETNSGWSSRIRRYIYMFFFSVLDLDLAFWDVNISERVRSMGIYNIPAQRYRLYRW